MHTIESARKQVIEELKRARVEAPELTADVLLGWVLGWDRVRILSHPEQPLDREARARLQSLVRRRSRGEPLQYLTGEREFYGHSFHVTPDVLIPRPETELLVEQAIAIIRAQFPSAARFADMGTGSGCIAISVLREIPYAFCYAIDRSAAALRIARENAVRHGVADRIAWICADVWESVRRSECLDLVLSNPPYIPRKDYNSLAIEVREHEPHTALFAGESGLDIYRRLIPGSMPRLVPGGYLLVELGAGQAAAVAQMAGGEGFVPDATVNDLQGIPRCLIARKPRRNHG